jgi:hypothetical protein
MVYHILITFMGSWNNIADVQHIFPAHLYFVKKTLRGYTVVYITKTLFINVREKHVWRTFKEHSTNVFPACKNMLGRHMRMTCFARIPKTLLYANVSTMFFHATPLKLLECFLKHHTYSIVLEHSCSILTLAKSRITEML